jgi:hypothetical protein
MRIGGSDFKDISVVAREEPQILDWLNLPRSACAVSLWDSLHDAEITSIGSDLLARTLHLSCEIEHLREFHHLPPGFSFIFKFEGVQSARVLGYAIWPGGCTLPAGLSVEEQRRMVAEYQAKWREESASWTEFESGLGREKNRIFGISDAAITATEKGSVALKISGHLNHETYRELFLRFDAFEIAGSDGREMELEAFLRMGDKYWAAYSAQSRQ